MAKKMNVDFKKILLEKGERIGLGIAVGFMALLLILGAMSGLGKKSPKGELEAGTLALQRNMDSTDPKGSIPTPKVAGVGKDVPFPPMSQEPLFAPDSPEDTKKRNPSILNLVDYQVQYLRVPVRSIERGNKQVQKVVPKGGNPAKEGEFAEKIQPTRMVIVSATFPYAQQLELYRIALRAASVQDLKDYPRFLGLFIYRRTILPSGKVVKFKVEGDKESEWETIVGNDPKADPPKIHGLLSVAPDIQPEDPKQKDYLVLGLAMPRPVLAGVATYPALKNLRGIPNGAEPKLAVENTADARSGADTDQVKGVDLEDLTEEERNRLNGVGLDIFDPFFNPAAKKNAEGRPNGKFKNPMALCRFINVDVKPGHAYDYTILIRAVNPNFGKIDEVKAEKFAAAPELLSNYNYIPRVEIPYDVELYAADELALDKLFKKENAMTGAELPRATPDKVAVQVHRWVDRIKNQELSSPFNLGEWLIAERLLVRRGEFLGRDVFVDVPKWDQVAKKFFLARPNVKGKGAKANKNPIGLLVEFAVMTEPELPRARIALLVDFHGGNQPYSTVTSNGKPKNLPSDESAVDLLVLTPEGRLMVRNGLEDSDVEYPAGKVRLERYEAVMSRIGKLKPAKEKKGAGENIFGPKQ